ncbi:PAAR domain-containing protein [Alcanivorax sp. 24]|uniref:PAAR domain-containing protein n=1 Tax=Alcanivorax sp. 24 TaxID=2545266 RepID=UPI00105F4B96|nr:PAAR domain-containing protein [Alcanivorax sp. 24]
MSRPIIVLGDKTDHGGTVIGASTTTDIDGKGVARVGDKVICPKHGPSPIITTIATGDPTNLVDGQPVARHGDKTACGATLISSQAGSVVDAGGGKKGSDLGAVAAGLATVVGVSAAVIGARTSRYDEQIRFVNAKGAPLAGVSYRLEMDDGSVVEGETDDDGRSRRVETDQPRKVVKATLSSSRPECCGDQRHGHEASSLEVDVGNVTTSDQQVGSSLATVATPEGESRGLTSGEIAMARLIFGDSIDYGRVRVHNGEYLWFGLQPNDTAMTPNGEMYFNPKEFKQDFSNDRDSGPSGQIWFMHEMTHVWQYQLGFPVKWKRGNPLGWLMPYEYDADPAARFSDYNMEQQGDIIGDYFSLKVLGNRYGVAQDRYKVFSHLPLLEMILENFLRDPGDVANLPGGGKERRDARREKRSEERSADYYQYGENE